MLKYPVELDFDTNGTILVNFPDVPEAHTFGDNRAEALTHAVEALETALMGYMEDRRPIPPPANFKRKPHVLLPALTEAKLALYSAMRVERSRPGSGSTGSGLAGRRCAGHGHSRRSSPGLFRHHRR